MSKYMRKYLGIKIFPKMGYVFPENMLLICYNRVLI